LLTADKLLATYNALVFSAFISQAIYLSKFEIGRLLISMPKYVGTVIIFGS